MPKRREINVFSISFLDLISGALGAVIILYVAVPKANPEKEITEQITEKLKSREQEMSKMSEELEKLRPLEVEVKRLLAEIEELKEQSSNTSSSKPEELSQDSAPVDVGFNFKGKKIVFLIDTSRSMLDEDRMGQVKAGLKMLISSMPPSYSVDVVIFPNGERTPFKAMWGKLDLLSRFNKQDIFEFLYSLRPNGATPTRETLRFTLSHYPDLTDIVLLTDGEPSYHNSPIKDDIFDILRMVRELNLQKTQINVIGVGGEVLRDQTSKPYKFLKLLSEEHNGFFVGF